MNKEKAILTEQEQRAWDYIYPDCIGVKKDAWISMQEEYPRLRELDMPDTPNKRAR